MKDRTFERFYYERVVLSESCGCAEQVINVRDLDTFSRSPRQGTTTADLLAAVTGLFRKWSSTADRTAGARGTSAN